MKNSNVDFTKYGVKNSNGGNRDNIYKADIYMDDKGKPITAPTERKKVRNRIRKTLEKFISAYDHIRGNANKVADLKKDWQIFAKAVYLDINIVANTNATNYVEATAMAKALGGQKPPQKSKVTKPKATIPTIVETPKIDG